MCDLLRYLNSNKSSKAKIAPGRDTKGRRQLIPRGVQHTRRPRNIKSFERAKGPEAVGRSGEIRVYLREGDPKVKPFVRLAHREVKKKCILTR